MHATNVSQACFHFASFESLNVSAVTCRHCAIAYRSIAAVVVAKLGTYRSQGDVSLSHVDVSLSHVDCFHTGMCDAGGTQLRLNQLVNASNSSTAATVLNSPYAEMAQAACSAQPIAAAVPAFQDYVGNIQNGMITIIPSWAQQNTDTLQRFVLSLIQAANYFKQPENADAVKKVIRTVIPVPIGCSANATTLDDFASRVLAIAVDSERGENIDGPVDLEALANYLAIRQAYGSYPSNAGSPIDLVQSNATGMWYDAYYNVTLARSQQS